MFVDKIRRQCGSAFPDWTNLYYNYLDYDQDIDIEEEDENNDFLSSDGNRGAHRLTAFLLFAKKTRPKVLEANPGLDFSSLNQKLRELWSSLPNSDKAIWKRKLNRIGMESHSNQQHRMTKLVSRNPHARGGPMTNNSGQYKGAIHVLLSKFYQDFLETHFILILS